MRIGGLDLGRGPILAPMAGITDLAFRVICHKFGCALSFTEMVSAKGLIHQDAGSFKLLLGDARANPCGAQLFGADPEAVGRAAERIREMPFALIDINMGCPMPKIVKNGEGSALMRDPGLAGRVIASAVRHAGKPVTVKLRAGWDKEHINVPEIARVAQEEGAAAVSVHGRTREQMYLGKADWDIIGEVASRLSIPVIGNGDIFCAEDALEMLSKTGCAAVMAARGATGNPWLFLQMRAALDGQPPPGKPGAQERAETAKEQFLLMCNFKGENVAVREMRKHAGWYLRGIKGAAALRARANAAGSADELLSVLETLAESEN